MNTYYVLCVHAKLLPTKLCLTVCNPMDCSPPGFPVHRILQTRLLEWIAMLSSRESSQSRNRALISYLSCLTDSFATISATSVQFSSVTQSCLTLCDPMNHSTPGLPGHHHLPEFTQTHIHRVRDAIQPSHPLSSPSPPAPNPSEHQSLFQ